MQGEHGLLPFALQSDKAHPRMLCCFPGRFGIRASVLFVFTNDLTNCAAMSRT
jgi:hypothetical protein